MQTVGLIHTLEQCLNRMQTVGLIHTLEQCLNRMQTVGLIHTLEQCLNRMQTMGLIHTLEQCLNRMQTVGLISQEACWEPADRLFVAQEERAVLCVLSLHARGPLRLPVRPPTDR
ncbi:hypothetical protein AAFF_G00247670 [Aldrovandia affinis]|uniref:Uncharacterized protein n=1 Tax=Aldrovandia affinis TaxID=143900 RepID=A0AAD7RD84_9TELE|nr:hypothetical protein AAFF_G00247670 [Aldrovandia affinis]